MMTVAAAARFAAVAVLGALLVSELVVLSNHKVSLSLLAKRVGLELTVVCLARDPGVLLRACRVASEHV